MGSGWRVGGWVVCCNYSVYSGPDLLNLRLRLNWRGPVRHLKLTWRWSGPEFDNKKKYYFLGCFVIVNALYPVLLHCAMIVAFGSHCGIFGWEMQSLFGQLDQ